MEEGSPSTEAMSKASLKETPPRFLARWKTAAYKDKLTSRKLVGVKADMEAESGRVTEEDFKPQRVKIKRGSTSGQTWEVDVGKEWVSSQHQNVGQQITNDPLEKVVARNTARSWSRALDTMKELEIFLKKNKLEEFPESVKIGSRSSKQKRIGWS